VGALISNPALIKGVCCVAAGPDAGGPRFKREEVGHQRADDADLAAIVFPWGHCAVRRSSLLSPQSEASTILHASVDFRCPLCFHTQHTLHTPFWLEEIEAGRHPGHPPPRPAGRNCHNARQLVPQLAGIIGAIHSGLDSGDRYLTGSTDPVTHILGGPRSSWGLHRVANAGNAAEAYAAIRFAVSRGGIDPEKKTGSRPSAREVCPSIQIATFVAPLVVPCCSPFGQQHELLVFSPVELAIWAYSPLFVYLS